MRDGKLVKLLVNIGGVRGGGRGLPRNQNARLIGFPAMNINVPIDHASLFVLERYQSQRY